MTAFTQPDSTTTELPAWAALVDAAIAALGVRTRNRIIGGDFSTNPWQRGTSFAAVADGTYTADRWLYKKVGAVVHTIAKVADAPTVAQAGRLTNHCLQLDCTTVDAAIAAGDYCYVSQKVEGYNFLPLAQAAMTLTFWHKHTKAGTYCVAFRNSGTDRSYVAEYTQAVTDTWELATVTVSASPSAGTWDYTTGTGIEVVFALSAGSNFNAATASAWNSLDDFATANQVNATDSTSNNFELALVQLEQGSIATTFEGRTWQEELALCQRYCELSGHGAAGGWYSAAAAQVGGKFSVPKRAVPTMALTTTTPTISEVGIANRAGTGSTYANNGSPTVCGWDGNIDGFSAATANHPAILLSDAILATAEL